MEDIELPKGSEPLANQQHEELAQAFIITGTKKKAGDMAGYTDKSNAWRAMHREDVQTRIKFLQDERAEELGLDAYYVLKSLKSVAERCMQGGVVYIQSFDEIVVHPDADNCYAELMAYSYKKDKFDEITTEILDKDNHYADALRYALEPYIAVMSKN